MASLRCHGDSDCNKTQIRGIFHLYIIQLWKPFFHIFTHGDVVNAQTWGVSHQKESNRATLIKVFGNRKKDTYSKKAGGEFRLFYCFEFSHAHRSAVLT